MSFLNFTTGFVAWGLLALAYFVGLAFYGDRRRVRLGRRLFGEALAGDMVVSVSLSRRRWRRAFFALGVGLAFFSLARPWWGKRLTPQAYVSREVVVLFDCSKSMLAEDVAPSRMAHGKWLARQTIARFPGDRFAIVAFAGDAFLECPPTRDRSSLEFILDDLSVDTIPLGGTNLEHALAEAESVFAEDGGERAIILFSDGEDLQGDVSSRTRSLRQQGIPVLAVGLGNPERGAPIRDADGRFVRDREGAVVSTRLDEERLRLVARETDGLYVRSTAVNPHLETIAQRIEALVPEAGEERVRQREIERYQFPLAAGLLSFLAFMSLGERRRTRPLALRRPAGTVLGLIFATTLCFAPRYRGADMPSGRGDETEVLRQTIASASGEERGRLLHNLGVVYQQRDEWVRAADVYREALAYVPTGSAVAAAAKWNLGVCLHELGRREILRQPEATLEHFARAEDNYRDALRWADDAAALGRNQEMLLGERRFAKEIQRHFDELSRLQDEAREAVEQAAEKQSEAAGEGDSEQRRSVQEQAREATSAARRSLQDMQRELDRFRSEDDERSTPADAAAEAVDRAVERQDEAEDLGLAGEEADERLAQAAEELRRAAEWLSPPPDKQPEDERNGDTAAEEGGKDGGEDEGEDEGEPNDGETGEDGELAAADDDGEALAEQPAGDERGELDPAQAQAILQAMRAGEKDLRDALKQQRLENRRLEPVERDW